jgi:hypothetical protein
MIPKERGAGGANPESEHAATSEQTPSENDSEKSLKYGGL